MHAEVGPNGKLPVKAHPNDAGFDLFASEDYTIPPGKCCVVGTDVKVAIHDGFYGQIATRSGMAANRQIMTFGGVIDSNYRGELKVILMNLGDFECTIRKGDKIAQLVIIAIYTGTFTEGPLDVTDRGQSGFGSTG